MPFHRQTLKELDQQIFSSLSSRLGIAPLKHSVIGVISRVLAGAVHTMLGFLSFMSRQLFTNTSDDEHLLRQASIYKIFRKPADFSQGEILFGGFLFEIVPSGTVVQSKDGVQYETLAEVEIGQNLGSERFGEGQVLARALEAGPQGNLPFGEALTVVSPIERVSSLVHVVGVGLTGGVDEEDVESVRSRLRERMQAPPQGGDNSHYIQWAREVSGVTRAWVYPSHMGVGTVGVTFVRDGESFIFPDSSSIQTVQDYIEARRPLAAELFVFSAIEKPINPHILISPDTPGVRASVTTQLEDLIMREATPANAFDVNTQLDGKILLSHIREAISVAGGEVNHELVSPTSNIVPVTGEIVTLGTVTWG